MSPGYIVSVTFKKNVPFQKGLYATLRLYYLNKYHSSQQSTSLVVLVKFEVEPWALCILDWLCNSGHTLTPFTEWDAGKGCIRN